MKKAKPMLMPQEPMMKKVPAKAGRPQNAVKSVQDLKDTYKKKFGPGK